MTIDELRQKLGLDRRSIRYLISSGALPPAMKRGGPAADAYNDAHLQAALLYQDLRAKGVSHREAAEILESERAKLAAGSGLELKIVDCAAFSAASSGELRHFLDRAKRAIAVKKETLP